MTLKKISMLVLAFAFVFVIPFTSVSASEKELVNSVVTTPSVSPMGAGEWDYVGSSHVSYLDAGIYRSGYAHSTGGDFLVCATRGNYYALWEYDPTNADDHVSTKWIPAGGCTAWRDIGGFVDGDNKKAEFYVVANASAYVDFYD